MLLEAFILNELIIRREMGKTFNGRVVGNCATIGILAIALLTSIALGQTAPDNTKKNQSGGATAERQGNSKTDLELTQNIRKALIADKTLSTSAHNVKVITNNGAVILKGPVASADEKASVEAKAKEIAGTDNVKSRIEVMAPKKQ
jgi:osmotically-inducible protein OsmY